MKTIKENRLFRKAYSKGCKCICGDFVLYCLKNNLKESFYGVTVSKKLGKANVRNKVRRRIKEIIRLNEKNIKDGYFIVVVARTRAVYAEYSQLEKNLLGLLKEAKVLV